MPGKFSDIQSINSEALASSGLSASIQQARRWLDMALDLIYPPRCMACGRVDTHWCPRCHRSLQATEIQVIAETKAHGLQTASTGIHEGLLQSAVQALKYGSVQSLAHDFAARMTVVLQSLNWQFDGIVPVPMHIDRLRKRGYNQAALIAESLAKASNTTYTENAVLRSIATRTQVGLTRAERLQNVSDAFTASPAECKDRSFIIVDDVLTTGATLAGCAAALYDAGAVHVYGLTVTTARPDHWDAGLT